MKNVTTLRCHTSSRRLVKIQKFDKESLWGSSLSHTLLVGVQNGTTPYGGQFAVPNKITKHLYICLAIPILGIEPAAISAHL